MSKSLSVAEIRRARARLARRLGRGGEIMKGSLVMRATRCGRAGCKCAKGEKHGPYLYVSVFREGRTRSVYVPQHLEGEVRRWVESAKQLERDVAEITWLNADLLRRARESSGKAVPKRAGSIRPERSPVSRRSKR
jgi:hypothetical protein